jgi:hypothetical protein
LPKRVCPAWRDHERQPNPYCWEDRLFDPGLARLAKIKKKKYKRVPDNPLEGEFNPAEQGEKSFQIE